MRLPEPMRPALLAVLGACAVPSAAVVLQSDPPPDLPFDLLEISKCSSAVKKDFDVVVYGATGFIGQLISEYLVQGHPQHPVWAIGGRNGPKLQRLRDGLATVYPDAKRIGVIAAASTDAEALRAMAKRTKVIINVAGPFPLFGAERLITAAILGCAHYVDISVDTVWKSQVQKKFAYAAEQRGVAIVQGAGFASTAADFLALAAANDYVEETGRQPKTVAIVWTRLNSIGVGGGQQRQFADMQARGVFWAQDPYILAPWLPAKRRVDNVMDGLEDLGLESELGHMAQKYFYASFDAPVARSTLCQAFPNATISVRESQDVRVLSNLAIFKSDKRFQEYPPPQYPQPGEGVPKWIINGGSFVGQAIAVGAVEHRHKFVKVVMDGKGDPQAKGTARFAIEVGLHLALRGPERGPGYHTPGLAVGPESFERRLQKIDGGNFVHITHDKMEA